MTIYERIKNGENETDIVKEFTDQLNAARKAIAMEERTAQIAAEKAKREKRRLQLAGEIGEALNTYMNEMFNTNTQSLSAQEVADMLDSVMESEKYIKQVSENCMNTFNKIETKIKENKNKHNISQKEDPTRANFQGDNLFYSIKDFLDIF